MPGISLFWGGEWEGYPLPQLTRSPGGVLWTPPAESGAKKILNQYGMSEDQNRPMYTTEVPVQSRVFTTRCYAYAVLAMGLCPSVSVSVCHKPVFYYNNNNNNNDRLTAFDPGQPG